MQYVGARYVPKFMGAYDPTVNYENLCVVDDGMGTSYISNKPTPMGTPLSDRTYWAVYGVTSGAILNLQDQIDDIVAHNTALSVKALSEYTSNNLTLADALNDESIGVLILDEDSMVSAMIEVVRTNPLYVMGNNHLIYSTKLSLIRIINGTSNITFDSVEFAVYGYSKADLTTCNMLEVYPINYTQIASDNIVVKNCDFHGGNIAFVASYASNIVIDNCHFHDLHYPTGAGSGGYAILTQVVQNLFINDCVFDDFNEGRHDIYISSMPDVLTGPMTENVHITDCFFDHSSFNSDTPDSTSVQFRQCNGGVVSNNIFKEVGQTIVTNPTNFKVTNLFINDNIVEKFTPHPATQYDVINILGTASLDCEVYINNFIVNSVDSSVTEYRIIDAYNCKLRGHNICGKSAECILQIYGTTDVELDDVYINNGTQRLLYTNDSAVLTGHVRVHGTGRRGMVAPASMPVDFVTDEIVITNNVLQQTYDCVPPISFTVDNDTKVFTLTMLGVDSLAVRPIAMAQNGFVYYLGSSDNTYTFKVKDENGTDKTLFSGIIKLIK